jgi:molybdopterin/thiamine biosynthesis adenylyltransferase/rhodanese-related sulfurtransferase
MTNQFSKEELLRYGRQTILPMIGLEGQSKLKAARVLFVGAGGLGSAPAIYLAAAGVGTIGLIDNDIVSLSNLHRQILHFTSDLDKPKVVSAADKLKDLNPNVKIITHEERLTAENALSIFANYDLIIDGTDNLPSRYLINDACFFSQKSFIFGGVFQFEGQVSLFGGNGPCYRCLFRDPPPPEDMPSCAEAGVLGVVPGLMGLLQANEAIKYICKIGESLSGRLLIFDALATRLREVRIKKDVHCPLCGDNPSIKKLEEFNWVCKTAAVEEITVAQLNELRKKNPQIYLLDVREQHEWDMGHIEGSHHIPLGSIAEHLNEIPADRPIYCLCKLGGRSKKAIEIMKTKGHSKLVNVKGGINAWSKEIDSSIPQY